MWGAIAGGVSSIISGALNNSAARHAATVANQRNVYNYQHRYQWSMISIHAPLARCDSL